MSDLNQFQCIGRLGRDPETKVFSNGDKVCNFSLAVSEKWTDKSSGEKKERTEWIRCVSNRKLADICEQYLRKGSQCYISGKLRNKDWNDKDGQKRTTTEISVNDMQMLGSKAESDGNGNRQQAQTQQNSAQNNAEDDIPF
jgi:single-strand DNA-binding protein